MLSQLEELTVNTVIKEYGETQYAETLVEDPTHEHVMFFRIPLADSTEDEVHKRVITLLLTL